MAFPRQLIALGILCGAVILGLAIKPRTTIFTCTTFFDFAKQDKWAAFCRAMDSIQQHHTPQTLQRINQWVIVNEYSPNPKRDWSQAVQERYPFLEFVQKGPTDKGQAASMNMILQRINGYTNWIHWEETWYCRRPCLDRMFAVMDTTHISQLQVTQHKEKPNWLDSDLHPRVLRTTANGIQYYEIHSAKGTVQIIQRPIAEYSNECVQFWPLYSLLPSINRVSHNRVGHFSTNPNHWPFIFEWDYGRRWLQAGNTKAVLPDGPVVRDNTAHTSTYG